jgi:hypothetical protein
MDLFIWTDLHFKLFKWCLDQIKTFKTSKSLTPQNQTFVSSDAICVKFLNHSIFDWMSKQPNTVEWRQIFGPVLGWKSMYGPVKNSKLGLENKCQ